MDEFKVVEMLMPGETAAEGTIGEVLPPFLCPSNLGLFPPGIVGVTGYDRSICVRDLQDRP